MTKRWVAAMTVMGLVIVVANLAAVTLSQAQQARSDGAGAATKAKQWQAVAPGRVEPRTGEIKVGAAVSGVVDKVLVKANDKVFAGAPLIHLADDEFEARLAGAAAQVSVQKRTRDEASVSGKAADRRKAVDAMIDAERAVFDARGWLDRVATGDSGAIAAARATLARAQDDLAKRQDELRKADLAAPLLTAAEAQYASDHAEYLVARIALDKMTIRAPIDGTVLQVNIKAGELAAAGSPQPLVVVADLSALRVRAELDERDLGAVKVGQAVTVHAAAFPGRDFEGRVSSIAPLVEPARLDARGTRNQSDVDVVEVLVDLVGPTPLAVGMKADVFFRPEGAAN